MYTIQLTFTKRKISNNLIKDELPVNEGLDPVSVFPIEIVEIFIDLFRTLA